MSGLKGRVVFVTGGTGALGAALVRRLVGEGAAVHLLLRRDGLGPIADLAPSLTGHRGDLNDSESVRQALRESRPELVFHLARLRTPGIADDGAADAKAARDLGTALREEAPALRRWLQVERPEGAVDVEPTVDALLQAASAPGKAAAVTVQASAATGAAEKPEALLAKAAALYGKRAELLEREGKLQEAVLDLDRAVDHQPDNAEWRGRRGWLHLVQRQYPQARADLDRAVALEPSRADYRDSRSRLHFLHGRWDEALADLEAAAASGEEVLHCLLRRGQILALQGRTAEAAKAAASLRARPGCEAWAGVLEGYAALCAGDRAAAGSAFAAAAEAAGPQQQDVAERAGFYRAAAALMDAGDKVAKTEVKKGELLLCGMGVRVPQQLTLEAVQALQACDTVFCNVSGDDVIAFLALFCRDVRPIAFRDERDLGPCADTLLGATAGGKRVAFMTFGHALVFGPLADRVLATARKRDIPCRVLASVSSLDHYLAESGMALGHAFNGFQVYAWEELLRPDFSLDPKLPAIVFFGNFTREAQAEGIAATLRRFYPEKQECWVFGGREDSGLGARFPLSELPVRLRDVDIRRQIFLPPVR